MATNLPQARLPISEDGKTFSLPWLRFFQGLSSGTIDPAVIAALEAEIAAAEAAAAAAQATADEALAIADEAEAGISPSYGITFAALDEPYRQVSLSNPALIMMGLDGSDGVDGIGIPGSPGVAGAAGVAGIGIPGQDGSDGGDNFYLISGSGGVTSVGLSLPADFTVSGSPVTSSGTLTAVYATQSANTLFAGPTTGAAAAPTFRAMVTGDIPNSAVTLAKITNAAASSKLLGSGSSGSGAAYAELSLGTGLGISGTTVSVVANSAIGVYEGAVSGPPLLASLTWVNQGTATASNGARSLVMVAPAAVGGGLKLLQMASPVAPYSVYLRFEANAQAAGSIQFGLVLRNSTSGRLLYMSIFSTNATSLLNRVWQRWTSVTAFNANIDGPTPQWAQPKWMKIDVTSTTATASFSPNGVDWGVSGNTETLATFINAAGGTVDQIGFAAEPDNGAAAYFISAFTTTAPA